MTGYYVICTIIIVLFLWYLVECLVDVCVGFCPDTTEKVEDLVLEAYGNLRNYIAHVYKENLFRHIWITIILGILAWGLLFRAEVTTVGDKTTIEMKSENFKK